MSTVFLTPSTIAQLTEECKVFLSGLTVEIVDEKLCPTDGTNEEFKTRHRGLLAVPEPKLFACDSSDCTNKTLLFDGTDYTIDLSSGEVSFTSPQTDPVFINYCYSALTDAELEELLQSTIEEVSVLIHRKIDSSAVVADYQTLICKQLYSNVVSNLMLEARNFFSISADGISVSQDQIVGHLDAIKKSIEPEIVRLINQLRLWSKHDRFE